MRQLGASAAVWSTVTRWDVSIQLDRLLSDCLKNVPREHVADVEKALVWLRVLGLRVGPRSLSQRN